MNKDKLPKSCYAVLEQLQTTGWKTHKDLVTSTGLASRTIRNALRMLKEEKLIIEKFNFNDARQMLYLANTSTEITATA